MAFRVGKKKAADTELDRSQGIQQPDVIGIPHKQKTKYGDGPGDVGGYQNMLAIVAVGDHPGNWANQERSQHANHKQAANGKTGLGELGN